MLIGAVPWRFVRTPTTKVGQVAEAGTLHVLVGDLDHKLNAQRLPAKVFARAPSGLPTGHAAAGLCVLILPVFPRMIAQGIFTIRCEELHKLFAFGRSEAGTHPNVLKLACIVV